MARSLGVVARVVIVLAVLAASAGRVEAITLNEIMDLTRAGVSDEILLALIEVDQRVFSIDPVTLKTLKSAGVSPRVIVAIVKSGRMPPPPQPDPVVDVQTPDPPEPQVVVVERPVVREVAVAVPVPVYVTVGGRSRAHHRALPYVVPPSPFVPFGSTTTTPEPTHRPRAEPVYWGWGGKLRPDAWQPDSTPRKR